MPNSVNSVKYATPCVPNPIPKGIGGSSRVKGAAKKEHVQMGVAFTGDFELLVRMILHDVDRTLGAQNPIPKGIGGSSRVKGAAKKSMSRWV